MLSPATVVVVVVDYEQLITIALVVVSKIDPQLSNSRKKKTRQNHGQTTRTRQSKQHKRRSSEDRNAHPEMVETVNQIESWMEKKL